MSNILSFNTLHEATKDDMGKLMESLWDYEEEIPGKLLSMLDMLKQDDIYPVTRYEHSLQTATRAYQDGADEETIVVALLHDIGEVYSVRNHAAVSAEILKPYISDENYWLVYNHQIFQGHYYFDKIGLDINMRDKFKDHPTFEKTAYFCEYWDQNSFEKDFNSFSIDKFIPLLKRVVKKNMKREVNFKFVNSNK